jgi:hypothetical protein
MTDTDTIEFVKSYLLGDTIIAPIDVTPSVKDDENDADDKIRREEAIREQNPRYLAEKERMLMQQLDVNGSTFNHPCQNEQNTLTLLSSDKMHEVDIEFDYINESVLLNFIRVDAAHSKTFSDLMKSVKGFLIQEGIKTVYQYVLTSDWDMRLSHVSGFTFVRLVTDPGIPYVVTKTDTADIINAVCTAFGMDMTSHLDQ